MNTIINNLRNELDKNSDDQVKQSGQRFFKESILLYGIKTATVEKIGKSYFQLIKDQPKAEIFRLCNQLWQSGFIEESFIACNWSYYFHKQYEPEDFEIFEKWVTEYVGNWASCDTLCNHTVGEFVMKYPQYLDRLKEWAKSDNRWVRRASAVSLIIPARKGLFLKEIFEIAEILLTDKDDMVQKGYGWMLKVASQAHLREVYDFVVKRKATMPRTAYRYAIEKMPPGLRKKAMSKD
ncbi:MAG: DNA alkylation repair protein [Bacteroidales bacterium]|nr:DNA alkylation repair protein [Bacteroidales bacterium]